MKIIEIFLILSEYKNKKMPQRQIHKQNKLKNTTARTVQLSKYDISMNSMRKVENGMTED
jgi:hypothetical protein